MKILIAGGTGLIGSALAAHLEGSGHGVSLLSRRPARGSGTPPAFHWDPARGEIDPEALSGMDAVVNLAGEDLAAGRWTEERKRRMVESRVGATRFLVGRLAREASPPRVLVNASAVGYYGNRGEETLTEASAPGSGFLAGLCRDWEGEASRAREFKARVVILRFGVVVAGAGGILRKLLPIFRLGIGGPLGSGRQWMSWIALEDLVPIARLAIERDEIAEPVNVVADPVRNRDFAHALGRVLHRPAILPAPRPALQALFGEMADEALFASTRVEPRRVLELGFRHRFGSLEAALRSALARP